MENYMHSIDTIQRYISTRTDKNTVSDDFQWELTCAFFNPEGFDSGSFMRFPITEILAYIKSSHDYFLNESSRIISKYFLLPRAAEKNQMLNHLVMDFQRELEQHIREEDEHLIPYIEKLLDYMEYSALEYSFESKIKLIDFIISHDDMQEKYLKQLANELLKDSELSLRMMGSQLELLWRDLVVHARIEDEVLLAKANEVEQLL